MVWQFRKKLWLPLAAGLSLSLSAASVFAEDVEMDVAGAVNPVPAPTGSAAKANDDSKGLSEHLWQGSFDKAGDASREAELELKKQMKFNCDQAGAAGEGAAKAAAQAKCQALAKEIREYGGEAGSIRSTQRIFSDVSKVSDLAAVGAIGATAYAQLGKRDASQANSLKSVADIQETAGYASYAAGATDFTMGAYAYAAQKSRFDDMEEKLRKAKAPPNMISKVSAAAEATKQAAYSHMMYGAGKAAFGYASMYMAKQNRKQAEALTSLTAETPVVAPAVAAAVPTISGGAGGGGIVYSNNQPTFSLADGKSLSTAVETSTGTSPVFSSSGGSVMRATERNISSLGGSGASSGGSFLGAGSGGGAGGGTAGASAPAEEAEAAPAPNEKTGGYEINTLGGSPHYGGGSGSKSSGHGDVDAISSLITNAIGGTGPESAATGVNPGQVYREATTADEGEGSQASEAGVSSANRSLFEVMRNKYAKIIQGGRVLGPGAVEVRN